MADLSLKIKADFDQAQNALESLKKEAKDAGMTLTQFTKNFEDKHVDLFIEKQRLAGAAITAARGDIAALTSQKAAYGREIERLIKSGMDPESASIKRLQSEYNHFSSELEKNAKKHQEISSTLQNLSNTINVIKAGIDVAKNVINKFSENLQAAADAGDAVAKTARVIGMSAESFQELSYAAKASGVSSDSLKGNLQKLNKTVADVQNGTGTLTKYLEKNNKALLNDLKNVKNTDQAFTLLMNGIKNTSNEFVRAELAQAAFGKSGQELILMAEQGADGIASLREEARKYGIISNEAAAKSEEYKDAQDRVKTAIENVRNEIAAKMMPGLTDFMNGLANCVAGVDDFETDFYKVKIAVAAAAASIAAFVVVTKGAAIVNAFSNALTFLSGALKKLKATLFPEGVIVLAIGAIVGALVGFAEHSKRAAHEGERFAKAMTEQKEKANDLLKEYESLSPEKQKEFDLNTKLLEIYPELATSIDLATASYKEKTDAVKNLNLEKEKEAENKADDFLKKADKEKKGMDKYIEQKQKYIDKEKSLYEQNLQNKKEYEAGNGSINFFDESQIYQYEMELKRFDMYVDDYKKRMLNFRNQAAALLKPLGKTIDTDGKIIPIEFHPVVVDDNLQAAFKTFAEKLKEVEIPITASMQFNSDYSAADKFFKELLDKEINAAAQGTDITLQEANRRKKVVEDAYRVLTTTTGIGENELKAARQAANAAISKIDKEYTDQQKKAAEKRAADAAAAELKRVNFLTNILNNQNKTNNQIYQQNVEAAKKYLEERFSAEKNWEEKTIDERIKLLTDEQNRILANRNMSNSERLKTKEAFETAISQLEKKYTDERLNAEVKAAEERRQKIIEAKTAEIDAIKNMLEIIPLTEAQIENDRLDQISDFLTKRLAAEDAYRARTIEDDNLTGEERIQYIRDQAALVLEQIDAQNAAEREKFADHKEKLLELEKQYEANKALAKKAADELIIAEQKKLADKEKQIIIDKINAVKEMMQGYADVLASPFVNILSTISSIASSFIQAEQEKLSASFEAEQEAIRAQYEWIKEEEGFNQEQLQALLDSANEKKLSGEQLTADERAALEQDMNERLLQAEKDKNKKEAALQAEARQEARKQAVYNKLLQAAQIPIDTATAIMKAISMFGPPPSLLGIAGIAAASALGVAQLAAVIGTPLPSAETGGRFTVPYTGGVDGALMRVNSGETVDVTPRGQTSGEPCTFIFNFDGAAFARITNKLARRGELYTLQLSGAV